MAEQVTLTVVENCDDVGKEYTFTDRTHCTVGRSSSSYLRLDDCYVSRRHCVFDIEPPCVRLRDSGSRNGTYVNGEPIGTEGDDPDPVDMVLHDGDEVRIGAVLIHVAIEPIPLHSPSDPSEIRELAEVV